MSYFDPSQENESEQGNLKVVVSSYAKGLHWHFENEKKEYLSVILHTGSYGGGEGLFEILPSWKKPSKESSVKGFVTFGEVQKWINILSKRGRK